MRTRRAMSVSLPPEMVVEVERVRKAEHRTRSELIREALRTYFKRRIPEETPTADELAALRRGRAAVAAGDYMTYDQLIHELGAPRRRTRQKRA